MLMFGKAFKVALALIALSEWTSYAVNVSDAGSGAPFSLRDQYGQLHTHTYPRPQVSVLIFADREGSSQLEDWVRPLYTRYLDAIEIQGVAKLHGVPGFMKPMVRMLFRQGIDYPVLLDWTGQVCNQYVYEARVANVRVMGPDGVLIHQVNGKASEELLQQCFRIIDRCLSEKSGTPGPTADATPRAARRESAQP